MEHGSDHVDDQHEDGRHLFSDSNGYEGLHGIRYRDPHGRFEPHGLCQQPDRMFERVARDSYRNTERRNRCGHIRLEHRSDDLDNQHEYRRHLFSDSNRYEGLHRVRHGNIDG